MRQTSTHLAEKKTSRKQRRRRAMAAPFFTALFLLCVIAFVMPLRPKESMREKRRLAEFPEFSVSALVSGDYLDDISTWFSDTFPGREGWLDVATFISDLHGITNNVVSYSQISQSPVEPEITVPVVPDGQTQPTGQSGTTEDGQSAEIEPTPVPTPEPTPVAVEVLPPTESVETWGGLGDNDEKVIHGTALQIKGSAFERFSFSEGLANMNANLCSRAAKIAGEYEVRFFDMPIPASVGILLSSDLLDRLGMDDQGAAIVHKFTQESDDVIKVNVFNTLIAHNTEYIYYRTDHHWSALGAYYAYEAFCRMADFEPVPLEEYTELDMGDFLGSFYSTSPQPAKLETDRVYAYDPPGNITMRVYDSGTTYEWPVITDMTQSSIFSKYMAFLAGDHAMTVLTNEDLPDGPNCVVYKDSYGNPFVIYLAQHYHHVYALDYRKYDAMTMRSFIQNYGISDVILAESMSNAMGLGTYEMLDMRLGY